MSLDHYGQRWAFTWHIEAWKKMDDILQRHIRNVLLNENHRILIQISLKFIPNGRLEKWENHSKLFIETTRP